MKTALLTLFIAGALALQGQALQKYDAADIGYANTTLNKGLLNGYTINIGHYFNNKYYLGWGVSEYGASSYNSFGAFAQPSKFSLFEVHIDNRYDRDICDRFTVGATLRNGLLMPSLKETPARGEQKPATKESYMYAISPSISACYRIYLKPSKNASLWLKVSGGYRQAIGGSSFGSPADFSGANFTAGLICYTHR